MTRLPDPTGRRALSLYSDAPLSTRLHVTIRWLSCPFPAVAALVPARGRILDVGCGHGLFAAYLALQASDRDVVGVDIDPAKLAVARVAAAQARSQGARLTVDAAPSGRLPNGPWDAVVFVDVLYLLDAAGQRDLLASARSGLAPDGRLVVKEMGTRPRWKALWNSAQETLSVRLLHITEGSDLTFVPPEVTARYLATLGLTTQQRRLDRRRLHPHHAVLATTRPS